MRHAQEHWLKLQAEVAIEDALVLDSTHHEVVIRAEIEECKESFGDIAFHEGLEFLRSTKLLIARDALIEAELLHREIVRLRGCR